MRIVPLPKDHLGGFHGKGDDYDIAFTIYDGYKIVETQMHRMHEQKG